MVLLLATLSYATDYINPLHGTCYVTSVGHFVLWGFHWLYQSPAWYLLCYYRGPLGLYCLYSPFVQSVFVCPLTIKQQIWFWSTRALVDVVFTWTCVGSCQSVFSLSIRVQDCFLQTFGLVVICDSLLVYFECCQIMSIENKKFTLRYTCKFSLVMCCVYLPFA